MPSRNNRVWERTSVLPHSLPHSSRLVKAPAPHRGSWSLSNLAKGDKLSATWTSCCARAAINGWLMRARIHPKMSSTRLLQTAHRTSCTTYMITPPKISKILGSIPISRTMWLPHRGSILSESGLLAPGILGAIDHSLGNSSAGNLSILTSIKCKRKRRWLRMSYPLRVWALWVMIVNLITLNKRLIKNVYSISALKTMNPKWSLTKA